MIEKQIARDLIPLVNSVEYNMLQAYVKARMEAIKSQLTIATDFTMTCHLQGAFRELEILSKLRDYVNTDKV